MKTGKSNDNNKVIWYQGKEQDDREEKAKRLEGDLSKISEDRQKAQVLDAMLEEEARIQKEIDEAVKFEIENGPEGIRPADDATSFITPEEEEQVKAEIEQYLTFPPPKAAGFLMAVLVYERAKGDTFVLDGKKTSIIINDDTRSHDKYNQMTGLVIAQGPRCYKPGRDAFYFHENWFRKLIRPFFGWCMKPDRYPPDCKVGDWICFSRFEGQHLIYRGKPIVILADDKILFPVEHPSYVTRD